MMQSKGTSLFAQILQLVNRNQFAAAVRSYNGDRYVKGFPTWDHFVSMLFCHLTQAKSLREISAGLRSSLGKLSHMGVVRRPFIRRSPTPMDTGTGGSTSAYSSTFWRLPAAAGTGNGKYASRASSIVSTPR